MLFVDPVLIKEATLLRERCEKILLFDEVLLPKSEFVGSMWRALRLRVRRLTQKYRDPSTQSRASNMQIHIA